MDTDWDKPLDDDLSNNNISDNKSYQNKLLHDKLLKNDQSANSENNQISGTNYYTIISNTYD